MKQALLLAFLLFSQTPVAQEPEAEPSEEASGMTSGTFAGLKLRSIGPAVASGRIADFAVDPSNRSRYFAAAASGGIWLTQNAGVTWTPVFDAQSSYSIGALAMDPNDPLTVWAGSGENNSQRSVSYGDGVYRSVDGGKTWKKMGLDKSERIGKILIDPRDSKVVYVAAQGPLWGAGGDRGLYKTTDGGATWKNVLEISENTGVTDVAFDPRNPDWIYAAAYQRRRHVWTMINGGPESALYKSLDGGATWTKLKNGLPSVDLGRIGLAVSPAKPDVVYALIEAADGKGGVFRSDDRGASWRRRNPFNDSPFYYGEIVADPADPDRVYLLGTRIMVSDDGGATLRQLPAEFKHVDNHALWIDPGDTDYYLVGCDGGIYESFDRGEHWRFVANLPITQFYNVGVDNDEPFYNVYGGTQDNFTLGGPSRTPNASGIVNSDWFVVRGGDGFKVQIDPADPDVVYAEAQYGALVRFDKKTGERLGIQPLEAPGEEPLRWNWDSPLLISPHSPTRLYFAANKLFRSDDRGDSWSAVSGELSRAIDPNTLPVMGRIWPPEAVGKGDGTSYYGNATALAESPLVEGLLYVGTDDGLVQVSEDGGQNWRRQESFAGVPEMAYVSRLVASRHRADRVYASFDNHKNNDFAPHAARSDNRGRDWVSIVGDLPANGPVLALAEDPANPDLLFAGTEFGLFFSVDGGGKWVQLKGGLPTIAVRDLAVQARESDLVLATFGRGFYVLDDFSALRSVSRSLLEQESALFPVRDTWLYIEARPLGGPGASFQGSAFYTADNPPFGALVTYYLKDGLKTLKEKRKEAEKKAEQIQYPSLEKFREEALEKAPRVTLTIRDEGGAVVRRLDGPVSKGFHRVSWDLRHPAGQAPVDEEDDEDGPSGPLVLPGLYTVSLSKTVAGETVELGEPQSFRVVSPGMAGMGEQARLDLEAFQKRVTLLRGAVEGAIESATMAENRLKRIDLALREFPRESPELLAQTGVLIDQLKEIFIPLRGDAVVRRYGAPPPPSIRSAVQRIVGDLRFSTAPPTSTHRDRAKAVGEAFSKVLGDLRKLIEVDLASLEKDLDQAGVPWTPGRLPEWPPR